MMVYPEYAWTYQHHRHLPMDVLAVKMFTVRESREFVAVGRVDQESPVSPSHGVLI